MIPDSSNSRPSSPTTPETSEVTGQSDDPKAEDVIHSKTPETEGTKVSHRSTEKVEAAAQVTSSEEAISPREELARQLMAAFSQYSNDHPAPGESDKDFLQRSKKLESYESDTSLKALDKSLQKILTNKERLTSLPSAIRYGIVLAAAITKMKRQDTDGFEHVTGFLLDKYPERLPEFIEMLNLHYEYTFNPALLEDEEKREYFSGLATRTQFMPAIWLMTRQALTPGGPISPGQIIETLSSLEATRNEHNFVLNGFALTPDDVDMPFEVDRIDNHSEYHQALWVFSSLFNSRGKKSWSGAPDMDTFSDKLQKSLVLCLKQALAETQKQTFSQAMEVVESILPSVTASDRETRKKMQKMMTSGFGVDDIKAAESNWDLSTYQRDIAGLILAWHTRQEFLQRKANPLKSATLFRNIARRKNFTLLYMDAAKIFAGFGRYQEALKCLDELLKCPLSEAQKNMVINQHESYFRACEAATAREKPKENEWLVGLNVGGVQGVRKKPQKHAASKKGTKGKGGKGKPHGKQPAQHSQKSKTQPETPQLAPQESEVPSSTSAISTTGILSTEPAREEPVKRKPTAPISQSKFTGAEVYQPEGGWLPDGHSQVSEFYRDINAAREDFDLDREALCISNWLGRSKGTPIYGRICEEAAWFYIRQMESPFPGIHTLKGESAQNNSGLAKLAGQWLSRTEACYFDVPRGTGNDPDELRALINDIYEQHPELTKDPEYRKRIRGICSSRGHLYSNLSAYAPEGRYNHSYHQKLTDRYHAFYQLKQVADPGYSMAVSKEPEPKVKTVSKK